MCAALSSFVIVISVGPETEIVSGSNAKSAIAIEVPPPVSVAPVAAGSPGPGHEPARGDLPGVGPARGHRAC